MKRLVAKKILVEHVLNSEFIKKGGWEPSYLSVGNEQVTLANIIGILIDKQDKMLVIDDGTGQLPIRIFDSLNIDRFNVGDNVQIIGRVGEHENHKFLTCQVITNLALEWLKVRKEEVKRIDFNKPIEKKVEKKVVIEDVYSMKDTLVEQIKKMDLGDGVAVSELIKDSGSEKAVQSLLEEGEIFEVRPGKVRVLE